MKSTHVLLAASVSILGIAQAMAATPLSGRRKVHTNMVQESDQVCSFVQKGTQLQGTCVQSSGKVGITGKVDGEKVTWSYKTAYNGMPLTVSYTGDQKSATQISGSAEVAQFGVQGTFTAVRDEAAK